MDKLKKLAIPRLVIAASHSGAGKTTIVTGLLRVFRERGLVVQSYKVGPDYIDTGFHQLASGKPAHNLDTWLLPPDEMLAGFLATAANNDLVVIEGVMGLYDGGKNGISSTAAIAKLLDAPVILVLDARSMGESAAAVALGFKTYDKEVNLAGVIINRLGSLAHEAMIREPLERLGIPVLGAIRRNGEMTLPERHLGLTPVTEYDARETLAVLSKEISAQVEVEQLIDLARQAPPLGIVQTNPKTVTKTVRIGVAQDEVFSFYYPQSLHVLVESGAELIPFSVLNDPILPEVDGLLLGGGFPEMFLEQLAANKSMCHSIKQAGLGGMPIYAECGGLMYLCSGIIDFVGCKHELVGLIPAVCQMQTKLETVGYVVATSTCDNILCQTGETIRGHEFHFSRFLPEPDAANFPWAFKFKKVRTGAEYLGGFVSGNILASYLHLHFAGNKAMAKRFIEKCLAYRGGVFG